MKKFDFVGFVVFVVIVCECSFCCVVVIFGVILLMFSYILCELEI